MPFGIDVARKRFPSGHDDGPRFDERMLALPRLHGRKFMVATNSVWQLFMAVSGPKSGILAEPDSDCQSETPHAARKSLLRMAYSDSPFNLSGQQ
ncbi:MAG: hypothetical protein V5B40_19975 [Candidatus Accumulibacter meliphilus]|uniref:hypothetical protein n=1 Tax=Candidatus Accumulibacter meliphilus TaxID=2211374 RepID=UPI002FC2FA53